MEFLIFLRVFILITFVMAIAYGATRNVHVSKRGLVFTIISGAILVFVATSYFIDDKNNNLYNGYEMPYIHYMIASTIYLIYGIFLLLKATKLPSAPKRTKMVYTYHQRTEYVCICIMNSGKVLLTEKNEPIIVRIKKKEFADEVLEKYLQKNNFITTHSERIGKLTVKNKKIDDVYFCYLVNVENCEENKNWVNAKEILSLEINKNYKYMLCKIFIKEEFDDVL